LSEVLMFVITGGLVSFPFSILIWQGEGAIKVSSDTWDTKTKGVLAIGSLHIITGLVVQYSADIIQKGILNMERKTSTTR